MKQKIWIDLLNPSHPLFFKPLIKRFAKIRDLMITMRERGETIKIAKDLGIDGKVVGKDQEGAFSKATSISYRTIKLAILLGEYDIALSFENPMSIAVSMLRRKKSILMLDNDLKYSPGSGIIQKLESWVKTRADVLIVPKCTEETFKKHFNRSKILCYNGYKEDVYIADHVPDISILKKLPFKDYLVVRPEAFASFYVKHGKSLVPHLLDRFQKENINIVYLPRDKSDWKIVKNKNVHIPSEPLNGLDLISFSSGVLTGSGTMAREAAVMGKKAISFFPGDNLLSVDSDLIEKGLMVHSRDVDEIIEHLLKGNNQQTKVHDPISSQREFLEQLESALSD